MTVMIECISWLIKVTDINMYGGNLRLIHSDQFRYRHRAVSVEFIPTTGSEGHSTLHIMYSSY